MEGFEPRPRASQEVAAARRAQRHDTEPITPLALPTRQYVPFGVGALLIILLMIGMAYQITQAPALPLQITPVSTEVATDAPSALAAAPTPAPTDVPPVAKINAYAAPDGLLLGQIETTRQITPVAHYGSGWIQADVERSGRVWLRKADVPAVAMVGPDLAPVAAVSAPSTGRGLTVDQGGGEWTPPTATPEPAAPLTPEPTATITWPTSAPVAAPDFKKPDITGTCKLIGCLGEKAVDLARAQACHALYWQYGDVAENDAN